MGHIIRKRRERRMGNPSEIKEEENILENSIVEEIKINEKKEIIEQISIVKEQEIVDNIEEEKEVKKEEIPLNKRPSFRKGRPPKNV